MPNKKSISPSFTTKLSNTTYTVNLYFSKNAKETASDKLKKIMLKDLEKDDISK